MSASAASRSVPSSRSISATLCSTMSFSFSESASRSIIGASPSTSLVAAKRGGTPMRSAWSSTRWATAWMQRCTAPEQKSSRAGSCRAAAVAAAAWMSSSTPSFLTAEIGTTGTPSSSESFLILIVPPFERNSSIMLSATTIGMCSSMSWSVR